MLRFSAKGKFLMKSKLDSVVSACQISVTDESNVLLVNPYRQLLMEYSSDLELLHAISLKWESGIKNPTHAIKLTSDHFVVSHGNGYDSLNRVCIVDIDGNVLKYFGEVDIHDILRSPVYLEMAADGNIVVADNLNQRLLILDSSLEIVQELSPHKSKYPLGEVNSESRPRKLMLDEANSRLFVAENIFSCGGQSSDQLSAFTFSMHQHSTNTI